MVDKYKKLFNSTSYEELSLDEQMKLTERMFPIGIEVIDFRNRIHIVKKIIANNIDDYDVVVINIIDENDKNIHPGLIKPSKKMVKK